jgi:hypothetical protein
MFFPFLAAATVAIAFAQLGAMSVKIGILTSSLYAVILVAIALALYALATCRTCRDRQAAPRRSNGGICPVLLGLDSDYTFDDVTGWNISMDGYPSASESIGDNPTC